MYDPYQELEHFGIKGMKWGIRRYQNADGTLTAAGKKRKAKAVSRLDKYNKKVTEFRKRAREYEGIRDSSWVQSQIAKKVTQMVKHVMK